MLESMDRTLKILGDKNRLRILKLLEVKKMCVCELAFILNVTQPSVSRHLRKLCSAGFLGSQKSGFWTDYFLKSKEFSKKKFLKCIFVELEKDTQVKKDRKAAKKLDRSQLCGCRT